jgi:DNA-directed RNA polymerase specialized sigma24 family protein
VYRIARSVLIDPVRRQQPGEELEEGSATTPGLDEDDPDALVASWLPGLLAGLPEAYREPLRLVELEGHSQAEVAVLLGLSPSGACSRI